MAKMIAFESEYPNFPVRSGGFEYLFDKNGVLILHDGQKTLIDILISRSDIARGNKVPKDPSEYERKTELYKPEISVEDDRAAKMKFLKRYWPSIKPAIAGQHLDNHISVMMHMKEEPRKNYVKQIGG